MASLEREERYRPDLSDEQLFSLVAQIKVSMLMREVSRLNADQRAGLANQSWIPVKSH
jgi:hypothetical protein